MNNYVKFILIGAGVALLSVVMIGVISVMIHGGSGAVNAIDAWQQY